MAKKKQVPLHNPTVFSAILLTILLTTTCGKVATASPPTAGSRNTINQAGTSLNGLQRAAVEGDNVAALEVGNYYLNEGDLATAEFWFCISAENGGSEFQRSYGQYLVMNHDLDSQIRSIFWLKRAINGADQAIKDDILRSIDSFNRIVSNNGDICEEASHEKIQNFNRTNSAIAITGSLRDNQVVTLRIQALCGSGTAAETLFSYYTALEKLEQREYVSQIGAEDGDPKMQMEVATDLSQDESNHLSQLRARFWAFKVLKDSSDQKLLMNSRELLKNHPG